MLQKFRYLINNMRQDFLSEKRKKQIAKKIILSEIEHLQPTVTCNSCWYGNSYGGFYINPSLLNEESIIYSFGIGKDISFDKTCIKNHNCKVYGFDPTPKSINFVKEHVVNSNFIFFDYGIAVESGTKTFYLPKNPNGTSGSILDLDVVNIHNSIEVKMKSFIDIIQNLQHDYIDVLKIDIEGAEYEVLESILDTNIRIDQILIEFHDRLFDDEKLKSLAVTKKMKAKGYEIFASSISYEEISFIHKSKLAAI